jgi:hypothetical protein
MSLRSLAALTACLLLGGGCASRIALGPEERSGIEETVSKEPERFLRVSVFVTPFFGDATKKLLTPVPPELVRMMEQPDGTPINPGPVEKILPVGTRVRIEKVEFPTAFVMTGRVLMTPRWDTWVIVRAEGEPLPLVVVLPAQLATRDAFVGELERHLTHQDPTPRMEGWGEKVREAVRTKTTVFEMPAEALEMAWGYPESKSIRYEGSVRQESWSWAGGKRTAFLSDGRLVRTE